MACLVAALALGALSYAAVYIAWQLRIPTLGPTADLSELSGSSQPTVDAAIAGTRRCSHVSQPQFGSSCLDLDGIDEPGDHRLGAWGPPSLHAIAFGPTATDRPSPFMPRGAQQATRGASPVRLGAPTVSGRLPPRVIQRIVRQNLGRLRLCYQAGLRNNPDLRGQVVVRFVVGRDGGISNVGAGGDLPDGAVVSCVARAFYGLSLPEPDGGIVIASYPIAFAPPS